ncbi:MULTISPECIES: hypothetical protein [Sporosarcina]|uniref:hypothetical protein n=1 Tax=Sporosarcina TaxID=1569 RepID=UPI0012F4E9D4|nr:MULTISPECIES: hypothetical protein [Sporosarcina]
MHSTPTVAQKQDIQRLEDQIGQLIRIIANLNERINYLETIKTNPFLIPSDIK